MVTAAWARTWLSARVSKIQMSLVSAGVSLSGGFSLLSDPVVIGVLVGLVIGKPLGVLSGTFLVTRFTHAELNDDITWAQLVGVAVLAGIGFTVSLLVAELSFTGAEAEAAKAAAAWAVITSEIDIAGQGWKGTLDTIDGTVVEGIKYYLAAGVSQKVLADAYGLTAAQVKAVASAMQDMHETAKEEKVWVENLAGEWTAYTSAVDAAIAAKKEFDAGGSFTYDLTTRAGVEQYRAMNTGMEITWSNDQLIAFAKQGGSLQQLMQMGVIHMKAFAGGVQDNPEGGWAMVGEHGPETMYVPKGASIFPTGAGPGGGVTVYNTFHLVDNSENLARKVSDLITRQMLRGGARLGTV